MDQRRSTLENIDPLHPKWRWPSWRFNLSLKDLFGNLYEQYNKMEIPILEPVAFHHDVFELCSNAETLEDFHARLRERRAQRVEELWQCWNAVGYRVASWPPSLVNVRDTDEEAERWGAFLHFSREFSFDLLNRYFALFTHPQTSDLEPTIPASLVPPSPTRLSSQRSRHTSPSSADETSTASNQRFNRKRSSADASAVDEDNDDGCGPGAKKRRLSSAESSPDRHNGQTSLDRTEATETQGSETTPAAKSVSEKPRAIRRSSRIASRTQGPAPRRKPDVQTRRRSQAVNRGRSQAVKKTRPR